MPLAARSGEVGTEASSVRARVAIWAVATTVTLVVISSVSDAVAWGEAIRFQASAKAVGVVVREAWDAASVTLVDPVMLAPASTVTATSDVTVADASAVMTPKAPPASASV